MARLERPAKPKSQDAAAYVDRAHFAALGVEPARYIRYWSDAGRELRVKISPAALEYLASLPDAERDELIVKALAFADLNERPRIWATDFALLDGCTTEADVGNWYRSHGIRSRAQNFGTIRRPS